MHAVIGDVTVLHALRHRIRHDSKENLHALITLRTLFPVFFVLFYEKNRNYFCRACNACWTFSQIVSVFASNYANTEK